MTDKWFNEDLNQILAHHRYVVVTDTMGEGEFLLRYLPEDVVVLRTRNDQTELEARYHAEKMTGKVVFYSNRCEAQLTFIAEYAETSGLLVLDDMESWLHGHIFASTGSQTIIGHDKLMLAAKLSVGRDVAWWKNVAEGVREPLDTKGLLSSFLYDPEAERRRMDDTVWSVFTAEIYSWIGQQYAGQKPLVVAQEITDAILSGFARGTMDERSPLFRVYCLWADSASHVQQLRQYADAYKLPADLSVASLHPAHPFSAVDCLLFKQLSEALRMGKDMACITKCIKSRLECSYAKALRPSWLDDVLVLMQFAQPLLNSITDYSELAEVYRTKYAPLDAAIRHIYVAWLHDEATLRPIQEYYTQLCLPLFDKWYELAATYQPKQNGIVAKALSGTQRTAVIVCDGLRTEIAECVVRNIHDRMAHVNTNTTMSTLPSVTENGMSALFGCEHVETSAQKRYDTLRQQVTDVQILPLDKLNDSITAQHLVLTYGDIDQIGEKKQLSGLKDISGYEQEIADTIGHLLRMGYAKVVLTADHGFVITGLLDEADKEPKPAGILMKAEERFILTQDRLMTSRLIERESEYMGSHYQYYAPTDKPFVSKGAYGYAHGGFSPQECIIPVYEFCSDASDPVLGISIVNKDALRQVTGDYYTIKIKADENTGSLFMAERKLKIMLFAGSNNISTLLCTLQAGCTWQQEMQMHTSELKLVIVDQETSAQIDSCTIKKSSSRDLDGLL